MDTKNYIVVIIVKEDGKATKSVSELFMTLDERKKLIDKLWVKKGKYPKVFDFVVIDPNDMSRKLSTFDIYFEYIDTWKSTADMKAAAKAQLSV